MILSSELIDHFQFETDFVEENMRCIPMIVRMKLDIAGIKLKLDQWCKFNNHERSNLAKLKCENKSDIEAYRGYTISLIMGRTGQNASLINISQPFEWTVTEQIPGGVAEKIKEFNWSLSIHQWASISELQRFALIKLSRPGHENANFPLAMREFGLAQ